MSNAKTSDSQAVVVTGMGLLTCLGSLQQSWQSLLAGKSGIKFIQPFAGLPFYPLGAIAPKPIEISTITEPIVAAALADANLKLPLPDCAVVIGSSRGCQANWERYNAANWLETLPHQPAIATARYLQTTAPVLAPMAACATGIWAIARGYELVATNRCQRAVVGAVEAPITRLTLAAFERMGALAATGCFPFDRQREGLVLGEGGAVLVMETAALARSRRARVYGEILGFGLSCDAHHISSLDISNRAAYQAVKQCLSRSQIEAKTVDLIHAHGTGTELNDRREAKIIEHLFAPEVAVTATKGATGHTLGASSAISTALTLMAISQSIQPACIGLQQPECELNFVTKPRQKQINSALCFSFGFGGQNAVLAVGKYE
ncbi:beta-ketoacyl-ACP synthase [Myxosarcina sp. GI1]|uniref:beta-ketoacyl-ACP synthase n=1 Tax=Myxosarcina sp. GI1 TaxID=1541065 RepID=UPI0035291F60